MTTESGSCPAGFEDGERGQESKHATNGAPEAGKGEETDSSLEPPREHDSDDTLGSVQ